MAVRFGPKLLTAILVLVAGYVVGRWAGRTLDRLLANLKLEAPVRVLLVRVARLLVLALFAIVALQNLGIELLPLVAGLGVAGAGVALAMQGVLGNVVAGLTIIFTRPFHVGEYISVASEEGEVLDISLFSTTLGHLDLSRVVVPNRKIVGEILHNYGRIRRLALEVGISYGADVEGVQLAVAEILHANARVLRDPPPLVGVVRLDESKVVLSVAPWVAAHDYDVATREVYHAILSEFRARNIVIALPQREVRVLGVAGAHAPINAPSGDGS